MKRIKINKLKTKRPHTHESYTFSEYFNLTVKIRSTETGDVKCYLQMEYQTC